MRLWQQPHPHPQTLLIFAKIRVVMQLSIPEKGYLFIARDQARESAQIGSSGRKVGNCYTRNAIIQQIYL